MKFTVETESFIRLLQMLQERPTHVSRRCGTVRLIASGSRLSVEKNDLVAEVEAIVWQEGQCTVSAGRLLSALKQHQREPNLDVELSGQRLHVGAVQLPVLEHGPAVLTSPRRSRFYLKTNLGVVASRDVPECEFAFA